MDCRIGCCRITMRMIIMIDALQSLFTYDFMRNALYASLLVGIVCGLVGTLVVLNRIVFLGGGIAHAAYGGIGLTYYFGQDPLLGAILFSILSALGMGVVHLRTKTRSDTLIGVMWSIGMAVGIIFVSLTPGFKADLMSYLFGSLLAVPRSDIWFMLLLDAIILAVVLFWYKDFLSLSFDAEFARSTGVPVRLLYALMQVLTAVTVVMVIQVAGLILVIALLTIPPSMGRRMTPSLTGMMLASSLLCFAFCLAGLALAYVFDISPGAVIIAVATAAYGAQLLVKRR